MGTVHHRENATGVDPRLDTLISTWESECNFDFTIIQGARTAQQALDNYAKGRTAPGPHAGEPGYPPLGQTVTRSKDITQTAHGRVPAQAIDAMPLVNGRIAWDPKHPDGTPNLGYTISMFRLAQMQAIARRLGLECGADWKPPASPDLDHFSTFDWKTFPVSGEQQIPSPPPFIL